MPQIEVGFEIDVNGIVSVEATDQATGRSQSITIHPSGGLSQAEVDRLVQETRKRENDEKSKKEQEGVVRQLDGLVANTMRSVQALEGKLTPDEQQRILDAIERAKKVAQRSRPGRAQVAPQRDGEGGGHHRPGDAAPVSRSLVSRAPYRR